MSIYDSDRRYRRQMAGKLTRSVVYLLILGGVGLVSYQLGVEDLEAQKRQHEQVLQEINGRLGEMEQRVADQALQVRQALEKARMTEQRYAADVPRGTNRQLYDLMRARMADGLSVARLRFLIGSAQRERNCVDPDTRRFVVRTPVTSGPRSAASFGKDRITVTGQGASAKSDDGRPQAWFDPGKPVRLTFTAVGQPSTEHGGVLPFSHSVVLGEREFRFLIQAGRRGFVQITAEDCAYP